MLDATHIHRSKKQPTLTSTKQISCRKNLIDCPKFCVHNNLNNTNFQEVLIFYKDIKNTNKLCKQTL